MKPEEDPKDKAARLRERRMSELDQQRTAEETAGGLTTDLRSVYGLRSGKATSDLASYYANATAKKWLGTRERARESRGVSDFSGTHRYPQVFPYLNPPVKISRWFAKADISTNWKAIPMIETSTPMTSTAPWPNRTKQPAESATIDALKFDDFFSLLGRERASHWLEGFRDELLLEFSQAMPTETSRANIYHFCGRAGLIGFDALRIACHDFLETKPRHDTVLAIYQRLRSQADQARLEIERRCTLLV